MMKTVIIYISCAEKMSEECRLFFQQELDQNKLYLLEYQKQDGKKWNAGKVERLWKDLEDTVDVWPEWKLILADDRRQEVEADEYLNQDLFIKQLVDKLYSGFAKTEYQGTAPVVFYIWSSLGREYHLPRERDAMVLPQVWRVKFPGKSRFLFYYHETQRELPYECRSIVYCLLLLYIVMYELPIEHCRVEIIYRLDAEWSWQGLVHYAEKLEKQQEQIERITQEETVDTQDFFMAPVYADVHSGSRINESYRNRRARWSKRIVGVRNELKLLQRQFQRKAKKCFRDVKSTYWLYDIKDWNHREHQSCKDEYLEELRQLYENGIFDYEGSQKQIDALLESINKNQKWWSVVKEVLISLWVAALIICHMTAAELTPVVILIGLILVGIFCGSVNPLIPSRKQLEIKREYQEIAEQMEGFRNRINRELSLMERYRHECHRYNEWKAERERLETVNREGLRRLVELDNGRKWLKNLRRFVQEQSKESMDLADVESFPINREYIYRPSDWREGEKELETPGGEKVSFPYPMIDSIQIENCKRPG